MCGRFKDIPDGKGPEIFHTNGTGCVLWIGDNRFIVDQNENSSPIYVGSKMAKLFYCGSKSLIVELCRSAHVKAMEVAKETGALFSYDPKSEAAIVGINRGGA